MGTLQCSVPIMVSSKQLATFFSGFKEVATLWLSFDEYGFSLN